MTTFEGEIDVRPFITSIIKGWRIIIIAVFACALIGLAFSLLRPRVYEATANVLLIRKGAALTLSKDFTTVNDPTDIQSRIKAILAIADSDSTALQTYNQLKEKPGFRFSDYTSLQNAVVIENQGDVILVTASANSPQVSADIATEWANQIVNTVNQAYNEEQPVTDIQNQLKTAQADYDKTQSALEVFLGQDKTFQLQNQLNNVQSLYEMLTNDPQWTVSYYQARKNAMQQLIDASQALKDQLSSGNLSKATQAGAALAILRTRAEALFNQPNLLAVPSSDSTNPTNNSSGAGGAPSGSLTLDYTLSGLEGLSSETPDTMIADLDQITSQAEKEKTKAEEQIALASQQILKPADLDLIQQTSDQISALENQLEQLNSTKKELAAQRDTTWQAYQAISSKEIEIKNLSQLNNEVTLTGSAIPPVRPASRGTLLITLVAGFAGLFLALLGIVAAEWWKNSGHTPAVSGAAPTKD